MNIYIRITLTILLVAFISLSYFCTRIRGCRNKKAINYNPLVNIHDEKTCIYERRGCLDPKFMNYNQLATVSCEKDCEHCRSYKNDKNKVFSNKVDCIYCKNIKNYRGVTPSVSRTSCKPDKRERCDIIKKGCNQPWAFNHSMSSNIDDGTCVTITTFEQNLVAMSSQKKAMVTFRGELVLDIGEEGLNILVFDRNNNLNILDNRSYRVSDSFDEIDKMVDFMKSLSYDNIVVIISRGFAFRRFKNLNQTITNILLEFEKLGGKEKVFTDNSNYILIGTKKGDIYHEVISENTVFFPNTIITEETCRVNPATIYPFSEYTFFKEDVPPNELKKRCALEAAKHNTNNFGLWLNKCLVMTDDEYDNTLKKMPKSDECLAGIGQLSSINGYKFIKTTSKNDQFKKKMTGVYIYKSEYFGGDELLLTEEYYGPELKSKILENSKSSRLKDYKLDRIRSIRLPSDIIIYLVDTRNKLHTVVGPIDIEDIQKINKEQYKLTIQELTIKKIRPDSVVFCDTQNRCYIFGPGKHRLPPYLFLEIKYVKLSPSTKKVILYNDTNFASEIQVIEEKIEGIVELPRTIRSVKIL